MSGHSKWAQIKRKKALTDAKKGRLFSQLARLVEVAARKGSDFKSNPSLKIAVEKARVANMPADNIERAIQKGSYSLTPKDDLEKITYEAYGPGSVAILIHCITNNKNKTVAEIRHILSENNGRLVETGAVKWLFSEKAVIKVKKQDSLNPAKIEETAILNDAEDVLQTNNSIEIITQPNIVESLRTKLQNLGLLAPPVVSYEWRARNTITLNEENKEKLNQLLEDLSENEDVKNVFTNTN